METVFKSMQMMLLKHFCSVEQLIQRLPTIGLQPLQETMICHSFYCLSYCLGSGLQTNGELFLDQLLHHPSILPLSDYPPTRKSVSFKPERAKMSLSLNTQCISVTDGNQT